jgi:WXG100 family type VII secretion target
MGVGDQLVAAYKWTQEPLIKLPIDIPNIHKMESGAIDGAIDSAVKTVLDSTGLMGILEKVTGDVQALHSTAQQWLQQAHDTQQMVSTLRSSASQLEANWQGAASSSFGTFMGKTVSEIDAMAKDMSDTAEILNNAAQECQLAEDMVIMIIRELIEWTAMTLAATAVADLVTFGLATIVGGLAESAEVTAFIARATEVSEKLGQALEKLQEMIKMLKAARFGEARGMIKEFRAAGKLLKLGSAIKEGDGGFAASRAFAVGYKTLRVSSGAGLGAATGLAPGVGVGGLFGDVKSGATDEVTSDNGLGVVANAVNSATGSGPGNTAPYHLPPRPPYSGNEQPASNASIRQYLNSVVGSGAVPSAR